MKGDVLLDDPRALRALAHPTRLALLDRLAEGPATATAAGAAVGISASAASYHLRALAKWGLVTEAEGGRGRERPWRAAGFAFEPADHQSAAAAAAVSVLSAQIVDRGNRETMNFLEAESRLPTPWRRASRVSNTTLQVTAAEAAEIGEKLDELLTPYLRSARDDAPDDARPVRLLVRMFPRGTERL